MLQARIGGFQLHVKVKKKRNVFAVWEAGGGTLQSGGGMPQCGDGVCRSTGVTLEYGVYTPMQGVRPIAPQAGHYHRRGVGK